MRGSEVRREGGRKIIHRLQSSTTMTDNSCCYSSSSCCCCCYPLPHTHLCIAADRFFSFGGASLLSRRQAASCLHCFG